MTSTMYLMSTCIAPCCRSLPRCQLIECFEFCRNNLVCDANTTKFSDAQTKIEDFLNKLKNIEGEFHEQKMSECVCLYDVYARVNQYS